MRSQDRLENLIERLPEREVCYYLEQMTDGVSITEVLNGAKNAEEVAATKPA